MTAIILTANKSLRSYGVYMGKHTRFVLPPKFRKEHIAAIVVLCVGFIIYFVVAVRSQPEVPDLPQPPLKELAAKHQIDLGNFAIANRLSEKPYREILTSQFNVALLDNTPNWHFTNYSLRPSSDHFDFSQLDELVAFSEAQHMRMQAHHFVWGEEKWLPDWLKNDNYTRQQLLTLLEDHIHTVGNRYAGRIQEWTVVNEAFTRGKHIYGLRDWWQDHIGDSSYIDQSFLWARQADPKAVLILNDFQNESINEISDTMYAYIKDAKSRGIPIDGIGMQMHIDGTHPPMKDEVIKNMQRFGELGVKVYVTEFDVNMNDVKADSTDKDQIEYSIYYEMMRACIESKVCPSFSILGITDKETWYNHIGLKDPRPLPFDWDYQPKPAFYGLRHALEQN